MTRIMTFIAAVALAGLAAAQPLRYSITDLGTLGGEYSYAYGINAAGVVAGGAATPSQTNYVAQTAFLWFGGRLLDLGTLGGPACTTCSSEAGGPNALGESPVVSETGASAPSNEDFCGFGTHHQCLAATWNNGRLEQLPLLRGGHNSQAYWINFAGQVAGFSENGVTDNTCVVPFQVFRFEPVVWDQNGAHALSLLPGDTVGFAFGINDSGEAVGVSGLCSNVTLPPVGPGGPHAVLWQSNGLPMNLGNLGGVPSFAVAATINDLGQVGGASASSVDSTIHPFIWNKSTGMKDLGTFPGAIVTAITCCGTLNEDGDAVGFTLDSSFNSRGFLWHDDSLLDLNTLIPADSPLYVTNSSSINESGMIAAYAIVKSSCPSSNPPAWQANQVACTQIHAVLLAPR